MEKPVYLIFKGSRGVFRIETCEEKPSQFLNKQNLMNIPANVKAIQ